jgi:hypothetical protein
MGIFPGPLIAGPEPLSRRYGLLSAAAGPIDMDTHAKGGGYRYIPVSCGDAHTWAIDCSGGQVLSLAKTGDFENVEVDTGAFMVYASLECGSIGYTAPEFRDKVERRLLNGEQSAVERALWTGRGSDGTPLGIPNFQDDANNIIPTDDTSITAVLSRLEDYAYRVATSYGYTAYIHAPVSVAAYAARDYLIVKDGPLLKTPYGSVWVFGGSYPGTGAGGLPPPTGGAYLYVTGQTTVWRSADVFTYPVDQTLDRETNQHFLLSEREYAIGFDCFAGRLLFNPLGGS